MTFSSHIAGHISITNPLVHFGPNLPHLREDSRMNFLDPQLIIIGNVKIVHQILKGLEGQVGHIPFWKE